MNGKAALQLPNRRTDRKYSKVFGIRPKFQLSDVRRIYLIA
jgi:hypothetical protein